MLCRDPFEWFIGKPTDTFEFVLDQQSCINSNIHFIKFYLSPEGAD